MRMESSLKNLLIIYHSQSGKVEKMAQAIRVGASDSDIDQENLHIKFLKVKDAGLNDLLWCDGIIIGTPENFGYMSGAVKDFFDRTFYSAEGKLQGLPYCLFVSAGNDGSGAVTSVQRIVNGYAFKEIHPPLVSQGDVTDDMLKSCEEVGKTMAAGLEAGIF